VSRGRRGSLIGVAIVTFNGANWIRGCLESLRSSIQAVHIVVVDNCSTDITCQLVEQHYPEVELVRSSVNHGFGVGNNIAIARLLHQGCDKIFLLNQDAYVLPDTIELLRKFLDEHEDFGAVSPLHCSPSKHHVDMKTFRGYLGVGSPDFCDDAVMGRAQSHYQIKGINAAAWLVRSEVFRHVGGFDPLFFMYGEDDDLLERMKDHGIRFGLLPRARIVHLRQSPTSNPPRSWLERVRRRARLERSILLAQIKRPRFSQLFRLRLLLANGMLQPLAVWVVKFDSTELAAVVYAAVKLSTELRSVKRHANQLAVPGPHFLAAENCSVSRA
jgi:GT2 family glycosyltransferase